MFVRCERRPDAVEGVVSQISRRNVEFFRNALVTGSRSHHPKRGESAHAAPSFESSGVDLSRANQDSK